MITNFSVASGLETSGWFSSYFQRTLGSGPAWNANSGMPGLTANTLPAAYAAEGAISPSRPGADHRSLPVAGSWDQTLGCASVISSKREPVFTTIGLAQDSCSMT